MRSGFFRNRVDELLAERKVTRSWLAHQMGITDVTFCVMMKRNNPKLYTVIQIARILDVSVAELLNGCEEYLFI